MLKNIRPKKKNSNAAAAVATTATACNGLEAEIEQLRHDKQVLMAELVKLRRKQECTKLYIEDIEQRIVGTELEHCKAL